MVATPSRGGLRSGNGGNCHEKDPFDPVCDDGAGVAGSTGDGGGPGGVRLVLETQGRGRRLRRRRQARLRPLHRAARHVFRRRDLGHPLPPDRRLQDLRRSPGGGPGLQVLPRRALLALRRRRRGLLPARHQPRQHQQRSRLVRRGGGRHQDRPRLRRHGGRRLPQRRRDGAGKRHQHHLQRPGEPAAPRLRRQRRPRLALLRRSLFDLGARPAAPLSLPSIWCYHRRSFRGCCPKHGGSEMKRLVLGVFLLCAIGVVVPAGAVICTIDAVPASTLLLPYFEVDLNNPNGLTTLFSINNASATAVLAHVTVWSDLSVPVLDFNVYLTGYDVQTINLRDLLAGSVPVTASLGQDPTDKISPKGPKSQDVNFASCTGQLPPPPLPPSFLQHLALALTGKGSPLFGGLCSGRNLGDNVARGYITVDTVNNCTL